MAKSGPKMPKSHFAAPECLVAEFLDPAALGPPHLVPVPVDDRPALHSAAARRQLRSAQCSAVQCPCASPGHSPPAPSPASRPVPGTCQSAPPPRQPAPSHHHSFRSFACSSTHLALVLGHQVSQHAIHILNFIQEQLCLRVVPGAPLGYGCNPIPEPCLGPRACLMFSSTICSAWSRSILCRTSNPEASAGTSPSRIQGSAGRHCYYGRGRRLVNTNPSTLRSICM
jgi:hypothetical protein